MNAEGKGVEGSVCVSQWIEMLERAKGYEFEIRASVA